MNTTNSNLKGEKMNTATQSRITRVNFTYAIDGGLWIEREDGSRRWETFASITAEHGEQEAGRLRKIAYADGMTGMWYNADNGRNVFVNGEEVN